MERTGMKNNGESFFEDHSSFFLEKIIRDSPGPSLLRFSSSL